MSVAISIAGNSNDSNLILSSNNGVINEQNISPSLNLINNKLIEKVQTYVNTLEKNYLITLFDKNKKYEVKTPNSDFSTTKNTTINSVNKVLLALFLKNCSTKYGLDLYADINTYLPAGITTKEYVPGTTGFINASYPTEIITLMSIILYSAGTAGAFSGLPKYQQATTDLLVANSSNTELDFIDYYLTGTLYSKNVSEEYQYWKYHTWTTTIPDLESQNQGYYIAEHTISLLAAGNFLNAHLNLNKSGKEWFSEFLVDELKMTDFKFYPETFESFCIEKYNSGATFNLETALGSLGLSVANTNMRSLDNGVQICITDNISTNTTTGLCSIGKVEDYYEIGTDAGLFTLDSFVKGMMVILNKGLLDNPVNYGQIDYLFNNVFNTYTSSGNAKLRSDNSSIITSNGMGLQVFNNTYDRIGSDNSTVKYLKIDTEFNFGIMILTEEQDRRALINVANDVFNIMKIDLNNSISSDVVTNMGKVIKYNRDVALAL